MIYKTVIPFHGMCCHNYFFKGQKLEIIRQTSKNRLTINAYEILPNGKEIIRGSHNVKRSTFMQCCEVSNDT